MKTYNQHKNKTDKKHIEVLNCIYDVITDHPAYKIDSAKKLKKFCKNKDLEVSYTENTTPYIAIGKNYKLYLQRN